jgi:hypothetical protein
MGFIIPGVKFAFDKNRRGRQSKAFTNTIYLNENKNFNRRFPNNLYMRYSNKLWTTYKNMVIIVRKIRHNVFTKSHLNLLRQNLEKYITLMHELEIFINLKSTQKLTKENAKYLLKLIIYLQGSDLYLKSTECVSLSEIPPLEAVLNKQFDLLEGGCILFNKFLNKQLTIDLKNKDYYGINTETDFSKIKKFKIEDDVKMTILQDVLNAKNRKVTDLPDEILVKILSYSNNIKNILLTNKFFHQFVLSHKEFITYEVIATKYIHKYKLTNNTDNNDNHPLYEATDENYVLALHTPKLKKQLDSKLSQNIRELINSDFKQDINGNFVLTRYKDPDTLIIISSNGFETPYMTYQIYKSLNIDRVIPSSSWKDFEEIYNETISKSGEFYKIDRTVFQDFWNELSISIPFIDKFDPGNLETLKEGTYVDKLRIIIDLMISKTRFSNKLEDILYFVVSLIVKVEENIVDDQETSVIPIDIIKNYAVFYLRQQLEENGDDDEQQQERAHKTDDQLWQEIELKNPKFYVLLKNSANEELEEEICSLFYNNNVAGNANFWLSLKQMKEEKLIEELIGDCDITPVPYILNMLAF